MYLFTFSCLEPRIKVLYSMVTYVKTVLKNIMLYFSFQIWGNARKPYIIMNLVNQLNLMRTQ